jgi:hypothetical protein
MSYGKYITIVSRYMTVDKDKYLSQNFSYVNPFGVAHHTFLKGIVTTAQKKR